MTDSSNNVVWWAEGSWSGVITDRAVMLLPPSVPQDLTERLWWLLRSDEGSLTHALDELVMGMGGRLGAIPDFVLAVTTPDVLHMALRGEAEVEVDGRPVDAAGITTWFETTFTSPTSVVAKTPEKAGPILRPASDAVVCASRLIIKGGRDQTDDGEDEDSDRAGSTEPEHHDGVESDAGNDWADNVEDSPAAAVAAETTEVGAEAAAAVALTGQIPEAGPESTDDSADGFEAVASAAEAQDAQDAEEGRSAESTEAGRDAESAEPVVVDDTQEDSAPRADQADEGQASDEREESAHAVSADSQAARATEENEESIAVTGAVGEEPQEAAAQTSGPSAQASAEAFAAAFAEPAAEEQGEAHQAPPVLPIELPDFLMEAERQDQHDHSTPASPAPERVTLFDEVQDGHDREHRGAAGLTAEELAFAASSEELAAAPEAPEDEDPAASTLLAPPPPPSRADEESPVSASPGPVGEESADRPGDHDGRTIASLPEDLSKELRAELLNQGVTPDEPGEAPRVGRRQDPVAAPLDGADGRGGSAASAGSAGLAQAPASALLVQEAPRFGDHDGHTVAGLPEDLVGQLVSLIGGSEKEADEVLPVVAPAEPDAVRIVLSAVCGQGHPNPTNYTTCRECGAELNRPAKSVACPPLGRMVTASGESINLDRPVLVGRGPVASDVATVADVPVRALQIPSPNQLVSRNHILIELDAWSVLAQDLGNCNGTILNRAGEPSVRLAASNPVLLRSGDVLDLGDGQTLTFENLP